MNADEIDRRRKRCEHCHRPICWVSDGEGNRFPVDIVPHPEGAFAVELISGQLVAGKLTRGQAQGMRRAQIGTYRRHALSCPMAHRWAKSNSDRYAKAQRGLRAGRKK